MYQYLCNFYFGSKLSTKEIVIWTNQFNFHNFLLFVRNKKNKEEKVYVQFIIRSTQGRLQDS